MKTKVAPKAPNEIVLRIATQPMQFSDSVIQMRKDAVSLFKRAKRKKYRWFAGTEAGGGNPLEGILRDVGREYGFRVFKPSGQDCWVAIREDVIVGVNEVFFDKVVDGQAKKFTDKGVMGVEFVDVELGTVTILAAHYITKGRPDARTPEYKQYLQENAAIAAAIGKRARQHGRGAALVFYHGDQNIIDRDNDTFLGLAPMTTLGDELGIYPNTGHGNIDVIASYNHDGRVRGKSLKVLTDRVFRLFTDHFHTVGEFYVRVRRAS